MQNFCTLASAALSDSFQKTRWSKAQNLCISHLNLIGLFFPERKTHSILMPYIKKGTSLLLEALKVGIEVTGQQAEGNIYEGCYPDLQASGFSGVISIRVKQQPI